jgi:guanylate kinase
MIFFIIGKSGSGKDSIMKGILEEMNRRKGSAVLKQLVGYTTRPMRDGEVDGVEYHFVDTKTYRMLKRDKKILEERVYKTNKGRWHYFTANDEQLQNMNDLITVGSLEQYEGLNKGLGTPIIPIYIDIDGKTRKRRMLERENGMNSPDYKELNRRFQADENDFIGIEKVKGLVTIDNSGSLNSSVRTAVKYIKNMLEGFDMLRSEVLGIQEVGELSVTEFADKDDDLVDKEGDAKDTFEIRNGYK